jgi:tetratricopeptide (TPR) repeat protein
MQCACKDGWSCFCVEPADFALEEQAAWEQVHRIDERSLRASSHTELIRGRVACQVLGLLNRDRVLEKTGHPADKATERAAELLVSVSRQRVLFTEELLKRGVESRRGAEEDRYDSARQLFEALLYTGRAEEAEALFAELHALGPPDDDSASALLFLAATHLYFEQGRYAETLEVLDELRYTPLALHAEVGTTLLYMMGACLAELGDHEAALPLLQRSAELTRERAGTEDPLYRCRADSLERYRRSPGVPESDSEDFDKEAKPEVPARQLGDTLRAPNAIQALAFLEKSPLCASPALPKHGRSPAPVSCGRAPNAIQALAFLEQSPLCASSA